MKKLLTVLIIFSLLITPTIVRAEERYKASYEKTEGDYYIAFEVRQKDLYLNNFYAGQRLDDYIIDGYCTYKGYWFDYVVWANPDYVIQEGLQEISIGLLNKKDITFNIYMNGLKPVNEAGKQVQGNKKQLKGNAVNTRVTTLVIGKDFGDLPWPSFKNENGGFITGAYEPLNYSPDKLGVYDLEYRFIPDDINYEPIVGSIRVNARLPETEDPDEPTIPSLTATTVSLETATTYDINLDNKITGSTYLWSSSDTDIVEVNPKNGLIKAKKEGRAIITCEITLPDKSKKLLTSEVTVGFDDNAPLLTETELDLEVGDKFDINLENKIAKSKYRWASSDKKVVKVNSSNGKVTAMGAGEAYITCTITTPDRQVIVLRCDISVTEPTE